MDPTEIACKSKPSAILLLTHQPRYPSQYRKTSTHFCSNFKLSISVNYPRLPSNVHENIVHIPIYQQFLVSVSINRGQGGESTERIVLA